MPEHAPITKVEAATAMGATVHLTGAMVDESLAAARERAAEAGMAFIHPFNDPDVIAGQGGVGLELLEQIPDLSRVVVPVGGGGLISGIAIAIRSTRPDVEVIGVQVEACAPFLPSLEAGVPVPVESVPTIADGIAIKRPGELTLELVRRWVQGMTVVNEDDVSEAMVFLLERTKLVVEGAGAVGVAALLGGKLEPRPWDHRVRPVWRQRRRRSTCPGGATPRDPGGTTARSAGDAGRSPGDVGAAALSGRRGGRERRRLPAYAGRTRPAHPGDCRPAGAGDARRGTRGGGHRRDPRRRLPRAQAVRLSRVCPTSEPTTSRRIRLGVPLHSEHVVMFG